MVIKILRLPVVMDRTGLSRSSIYGRMGADDFPQSISLGGGRSIGWIESEVNDWLATQIELSRTSGIESSDKIGGGA